MSVFVDESGLNLGMTRLYGRAERGERLYDSCPRNLWKKHIVNRGALVWTDSLPPLVNPGSVNTDVFVTYVQEILAPQL